MITRRTSPRGGVRAGPGRGLNGERFPEREDDTGDGVVELDSALVKQSLLAGIEYNEPGPARLTNGVTREEMTN